MSVWTEIATKLATDPTVRRWAITGLAVMSVFADSASYVISMLLDGALAAAIIYLLWFHAPDERA